jgi:hypothetical protein
MYYFLFLLSTYPGRSDDLCIEYVLIGYKYMVITISLYFIIYLFNLVYRPSAMMAM